MSLEQSEVPTTAQLASIAAQLMGRTRADTEKASAKAAELWRACSWETYRMAEQAVPDETEINKHLDEHFAEEKAKLLETQCFLLGLSLPKKREMTFRELLRWLMPRVGEADRINRLRSYLQETHGAKREDTGPEIATLKKTTFTQSSYMAYAEHYVRWWHRHKSKVRSGAGKLGRAKRNNMA